MYAIWKKLYRGMAVAAVLTLTAGGAGAAQEPPATVEIKSLAQLYGAVSFDHAAHVSLADGCATCHHHTTGSAPLSPDCQRCHAGGEVSAQVGCGDCHSRAPFSAEYLREKDADVQRYHTDQPGLKAAYHLSCMGCHEENDGPTGCTDCHARSDAGDAFFHAGAYAPAGGAKGGAGH